jgi:hypothetical protein
MRIITPLVLSLVVLFNLPAFSGSVTIGGIFGYYSVSDTIYKDLYGPGSFLYGGFVSIGMMNRCELRGDISYFKDNGKTSLTGENTVFSLAPAAVGARINLIKVKSLRPYVGLGVSFNFYNERARIGDTSDIAVGFYFEGGSYILIGERFRFDLHLRYIRSNIKPYDETIKLGGINTRIGLGYTF